MKDTALTSALAPGSFAGVGFKLDGVTLEDLAGVMAVLDRGRDEVAGRDPRTAAVFHSLSTAIAAELLAAAEDREAHGELLAGVRWKLCGVEALQRSLAFLVGVAADVEGEHPGVARLVRVVAAAFEVELQRRGAIAPQRKIDA